jgi:hypothetical protein
MVRLRRDEDQRHEPLLTAIDDPMTLSRRRQDDLAGAQFAFLIPNRKRTAPFKNILNFVFPRMGVRFL